MEERIAAVIFDNDNTIAKIYPSPRVYWIDVFIKTIEECGGSIPKELQEEYMIAYFTKKGFMEKLAGIGLKTSWAHFQRAKGIVDERERIRYIREGKSTLFKDAVKFMRLLHSRGIKYGVATFTTARVVAEAFKHVDGLPAPQAIFDWNDSLRDNLEKPNPEIALRILGKLRVKPGAAMMVGDRLSDVQMGNLAGMKTVLVKRVEEDGDMVATMEKEIEEARSDPEAFQLIPDFQVTDLTQAEALL